MKNKNYDSASVRGQFVTYGIAKLLHELGCDYVCLASYSDKNTFNFGDGGLCYRVIPNKAGVYTAVLWQQAVDFVHKNTPKGFKHLKYNSDRKILAENIMTELKLMKKFRVKK